MDAWDILNANSSGGDAWERLNSLSGGTASYYGGFLADKQLILSTETPVSSFIVLGEAIPLNVLVPETSFDIRLVVQSLNALTPELSFAATPTEITLT